VTGSQDGTVPGTGITYQHNISGTVVVTLNGNPPAAPFTGSFTTSGTDNAVLVSGNGPPNGVGGGFTANSPVEPFNAGFQGIGTGNGFTLSIQGFFLNGNTSTINGTITLTIPNAGVFDMVMSMTLTKVSL
jgi:hypothetical protein